MFWLLSPQLGYSTKVSQHTCRAILRSSISGVMQAASGQNPKAANHATCTGRILCTQILRSLSHTLALHTWTPPYIEFIYLGVQQYIDLHIHIYIYICICICAHQDPENTTKELYSTYTWESPGMPLSPSPCQA